MKTLLLFLLLATPLWATERQLPDPPQGTPPLTQQTIDRIYCLPQVIAAINTIWLATGDGTEQYEAAFIVSSLGGIYIEPMDKGRPFAQTVYIFGNTVAIFHVHPTTGNPNEKWPSTPDDNYENNGMGDTGLADKFKIDVYVISIDGLTRYRPGVGNSEEVVGMEYLKGKECK